MSFKRPGIRHCVLIAAALLCSAALCVACGHREEGPYDLIPGEEDWGEPDPETRFVSAEIASVGLHKIVVRFDNIMSTTTVGIRVTDAMGNEIQRVDKEWSLDGYELTLRGPFAFCSRYYVTVAAGAQDAYSIILDQDLTMPLVTGRNPLNFDLDDRCTADVAISPVFASTAAPMDGALIPGDQIDREEARELMRPADIDPSRMLYVDGSQSYDGAQRMALIPVLADGGAAVLAKLFDSYEYDERGQIKGRLYDLNMWHEYDPLGADPTAWLTHSVGFSSYGKMQGPFDAGDVDGDGVNELIFSIPFTVYSGAVLQQVQLIKGPVAVGLEAAFPDLPGKGKLIGSLEEVLSRPVPIGDVDNDGMADLAFIRYEVTTIGTSRNWQVWVIHGSAKMEEALSLITMDEINAYPGRKIVDVDAADMNGDGISDLLVTEVEPRYISGKYVEIKPKVKIFFGGGSLNKLSMITPDSQVVFSTNNRCEISVRALGDISGDGRDDMGIHVIEKDRYGKVLANRVHLFTGRSVWMDGYQMSTNIGVASSAVIDLSGFGSVIWDDPLHDPRTGDIDNDGFFDFKVTAQSGDERNVYFFFGRDRFSQTGWKLNLDDADVIWTFDAD
ncbi:MAG: VCBS repeat-containing protein [Proteobacteria bacterium]|nr:VCBS repeat-containing protein [Pseudomonadota bacterium]